LRKAPLLAKGGNIISKNPDGMFFRHSKKSISQGLTVGHIMAYYINN
jgi:hypothetical protein